MIRNACAALAALAVVASAAAQAPDQPSTQGGPQATAAASPGAIEARRVVRDKETGKLRAPDTEELTEMLDQERADRAARGLPEPGTTPVVVRVHPDGMRSAVLGPDHLVSLQVERGAQGKLVLSHGDSAHEHASHPSPAPKE